MRTGIDPGRIEMPDLGLASGIVFAKPEGAKIFNM